MRLPNDEALAVIKWAYRALYLMLFISCMVVMGYWHVSITFTFLGSVFALIFPILFSKKELFQESSD